MIFVVSGLYTEPIDDKDDDKDCGDDDRGDGDAGVCVIFVLSSMSRLLNPKP